MPTGTGAVSGRAGGEWVLMEADGPGASSTSPSIATQPARRRYSGFILITLKAAAKVYDNAGGIWGKKAPFLRPLLTNTWDRTGRQRPRPIWVVRSFVPMAFAAHCKTSSVKLEGRGQSQRRGRLGTCGPTSWYRVGRGLSL